MLGGLFWSVASISSLSSCTEENRKERGREWEMWKEGRVDGRKVPVLPQHSAAPRWMSAWLSLPPASLCIWPSSLCCSAFVSPQDGVYFTGKSSPRERAQKHTLTCSICAGRQSKQWVLSARKTQKTHRLSVHTAAAGCLGFSLPRSLGTHRFCKKKIPLHSKILILNLSQALVVYIHTDMYGALSFDFCSLLHWPTILLSVLCSVVYLPTALLRLTAMCAGWKALLNWAEETGSKNRAGSSGENNKIMNKNCTELIEVGRGAHT